VSESETDLAPTLANEGMEIFSRRDLATMTKTAYRM